MRRYMADASSPGRFCRLITWTILITVLGFPYSDPIHYDTKNPSICPKTAGNQTMQPSGEIGRFEVVDVPSPPADRRRYPFEG